VPGRIRTLEMDEFWSFVGSKQRPRWTWYGFDRQRKQVVAFVNGGRIDLSGRALRGKLGQARVKAYHTDKWPTYRRCLPRLRHITDNEGTRQIERNHLNFRTRPEKAPKADDLLFEVRRET
jgi:insertion element IS1 protein InsB